ncbi:KRAB-A domain-containing protein 2-like [Aphis craccivora]|uniref:KRAB-A domain-containing protein 2-like n=1 Tax=Aphis craccivora TaxID=307492 RepID=A0A6G0ZEP8_APHCR|nr:KRAB-A domain-containing protein 2-like [Aphis craccivora]
MDNSYIWRSQDFSSGEAINFFTVVAYLGSSIIFYEKPDEYYFKKKPFTECAQLQMISEVQMTKIKTSVDDNIIDYYLHIKKNLEYIKFYKIKTKNKTFSLDIWCVTKIFFIKLMNIYHIGTGHVGKVKL